MRPALASLPQWPDGSPPESDEQLVDALERLGRVGWVGFGLGFESWVRVRELARQRGFRVRCSSSSDRPEVEYEMGRAGIDPLTGALNWAAFEDDLDPESAEPTRSFIYADINRLGRFSRPDAEAIVAVVGQTILARAAHRRVYRTHPYGDEFCIAFDDDANAAEEYADKLEYALTSLRLNLATPLEWYHLPVYAGVTVISLPSIPREGPDWLRVRASRLMQARKNADRAGKRGTPSLRDVLAQAEADTLDEQIETLKRQLGLTDAEEHSSIDPTGLPDRLALQRELASRSPHETPAQVLGRAIEQMRTRKLARKNR